MPGELTKINGAEIFWESAGEGSDVLLIHAGVADGRMWDQLFSVLAKKFRSIRYDMRGFGRSTFPGGPYSHVADLDGLFRAADVDSAAVVGASVGGQIAIDFALVHLGKVTGLVLAASALGGHEWSRMVQEFGGAEDAALDARDIDAAVELNLRLWVDGPRRGQDAVSPEVRERVRQMQRVAFEKQLVAYDQTPPPMPVDELDPPAAYRLGEIQVPTLVIVGDQDVPDFREIADRMAGDIPNAKKVEMNDAAHMLTLEKPAEFNDHVLKFLEGAT